MQWLVEDALIARLQVVEANEARKAAEDEAVAAAEARVKDAQKRARENRR